MLKTFIYVLSILKVQSVAYWQYNVVLGIHTYIRVCMYVRDSWNREKSEKFNRAALPSKRSKTKSKSRWSINCWEELTNVIICMCKFKCYANFWRKWAILFWFDEISGSTMTKLMPVTKICLQNGRTKQCEARISKQKGEI